MARPNIDSTLLLKFGDRLRHFRTGKKWSLAHLAGVSNLDIKFIHRLELGQKEPCLGTLKRLSVALGISIGELTDGL